MKTQIVIVAKQLGEVNKNSIVYPKQQYKTAKSEEQQNCTIDVFARLVEYKYSREKNSQHNSRQQVIAFKKIECPHTSAKLTTNRLLYLIIVNEIKKGPLKLKIINS